MKDLINRSKVSAFINRNEELKFLSNWISRLPESILFLFGPKSSGKTALLNKWMDEKIIRRHYDIKYINLRKIFMANYRNFLQAFFEIDYSIHKGNVKEKREYNLKVFKLTKEVMKGLESNEIDPFIVMEKELEKILKKKKTPIIIIDELQLLDGIYMNGQKELIKELFNFFVAMTKESHLCHVIIASSDGYFIDRIYNDSKLIKTSEFFEIDYLEKKDVEYWLNNLQRESQIKNLTLTENQIDLIWHYFGGSVWEINNFLSALMDKAEKKLTDDYIQKEAEKKIQTYQVRFQNYLGKHYDYDLFKAINDLLLQSDHFYEKDLIYQFERKLLKEELGILVQNNLFSYNPLNGQYKPQGNSIALGLKKFCTDLLNFKLPH
ncbi:ATP-binding protein [Candidatus Magnetomorum sp. HK-1]|nr:ATP-binding protein [Candidatus Magnetomorum sp. HK-1]